jgi:predicted N-acetyltransferase YhbS
MTELRIRPMKQSDRDEVAELICVSTNYWFETKGNPPVFPDGPESTTVYFDVYEALDPGQSFVAENATTGRLMGSVFLHPRQTHVSLGIMNVHPNHFRKGVASALLKSGTALADRENAPLRLVSSGRNLDSFSLYNRVGFVPRYLYQGMFLTVPEEGLALSVPGEDQVREATLADVEAMTALEMEVAGIRREKDLRYFIENTDGFWHVSIFENAAGKVEGFLTSSAHAGCNMIGPGAAKDGPQAAAMLLTELKRHKGRSPGYLLPCEYEELIQTCYAWGAKNFEIALGQVRGAWRPMQGVSIPTFLPETA